MATYIKAGYTLILLCLLLAGCASVQPQERMTVFAAIVAITPDNMIDTKCRLLGAKAYGKIKGCAAIDYKNRACTLILPPIGNNFRVWGEELGHCVYRDLH